jgi:putative DNA primase/helicase
MTKKQAASPAPDVINPNTPAKSAEKFKSLHNPTLLNFQNEWVSYGAGAYHSIEDATILSAVSLFLRNAKIESSEQVGGVHKIVYYPFHPKTKDINEVYNALKHDCHVPHNTMSPPVWLKDTPAEYAGLNPRNLISFQNGLLDTTTRILHKATPYFFTRTALAMNYDPDALKPAQWLAFLDETLLGRQALIDLLQEWLGYKITTDTSLHRVMFLWGRPRSGKGTILRIEEALVGKPNTAFPKIETLAGRFGLQGLIGKSSAQITDMNTDRKSDLGTAAANINGISGEDGQTVERKNMTNWDGNLGVRFTIAGNTLPDFGSHTGAMATRLMIIPFEVSFEGREDRALTERLKDELPGILNWALDGLDRLRLCGDFVEPADSIAAKKRLIYLSDPIHGFVEECCAVKAKTDIDKRILYDGYVRYCEATKARVQPLEQFTSRLTQIYPNVAASKRLIKGTRTQVPCYRGIEFNEAHSLKVYKIDKDMVALGCEGLEVLLRDASGWPIPADAAERNFGY